MTLLGCIITDVAVSLCSLQSTLTYAVNCSFYSISTDGDLSMNNTIVAFVNSMGAGKAGGVRINEVADVVLYIAFRDELTCFAQKLTQLVVHDGEGAAEFVTVSVTRGLMHTRRCRSC